MKVPREFFGMMYQGSSVDASGNVQPPYYPIPVGIQRLWDTGAVMTFLGGAPPFNFDGLRSQCALASRTNAKVLYTFGFGADPVYPPPAAALKPGSLNRPTPEYLEAVTDALFAFGVRIDFVELWNEAGLKREYWDGTVEEMHQQAAWLDAKVKALSPSTVTLSPSLNDLLQPSTLDFAEQYCALMRQQPACDGIAFHMYAGSVADINAQLANLDRVTQGLEHLPLYCTEYNGAWDAFDIMGSRGIKCVVLNGQQPPAPYSDPVLAQKWGAMVDRLTTVGTTDPPAPDLRTRGGCFR